MGKITFVLAIVVCTAFFIGVIFIQRSNEKKMQELGSQSKAEMSELRAELAKCVAKIGLLEESNARLDKDIAGYKHELTKTTEIEESSSKINQQIGEYKDELVGYQAKIAALEEGNDKLAKEIAGHKKDLLQIQKNIALLEENTLKLIQEIEKLKKEQEEMQGSDSLTLKSASADDLIEYFCSLPEDRFQAELKKLKEDYFKGKLKESSFGIYFLEKEFKDATAAEILVNMRRIANEFSARGDNIISFSNDVYPSPDNGPVRQISMMPSERKRIYACFKNEFVFARLDKVVAKWIDLSTQKLIRFRAYKLEPFSQNNNIPMQSVWTPGKYMVAIYKQIFDERPIAYGTFEITE